MDSAKKTRLVIGLGCGGLLLLLILAGASVLFLVPLPMMQEGRRVEDPTAGDTPEPALLATQEVVPTLPPTDPELAVGPAPEAFTELYERLNPGVVNIQVFAEQRSGTGQGAGSGFILDEEGHIVTNQHVIAEADFVAVIFFDGYQSAAEIVGTDLDSDLAVIKVAELPDNVHPLALGDSEGVVVGEWVVAIGNPFGLGSSLTAGIVSAVGRTIVGMTPFGIPHAVQTDAALNPGNSGGPLLTMDGYVIGVNAQIAATGPDPVSAGVGFAIPVNTVRRVVPALIETGAYAWPWLGIQGIPVDIFIQQANDLPTQRGVYIMEVVGGPAEAAGLQGATETTTVEGFSGVPVGGDVIVGFDGVEIEDFSDLQLRISQQQPGDSLTLIILREGEEVQIDLTLQARPSPAQ